MLAYDPKANSPNNNTPKLLVDYREKDIDENLLYTHVELGPMNYRKMITQKMMHLG